ncbi:thioredoxin family protein [Rhodopirellula baltica]|uniref:thioredoxin family protein n=1 Tax=Rhodopirellula baltica TaxID=265606 RepID=UPI0002DAC2A4|nr:thioredoxin domain-containing protein [Rhodopirellula baltica]
MRKICLLTFGVLSVAMFGCGRSESPSANEKVRRNGVTPAQLTDANFQREVIESELPVLVDMWAPWCQPCIAMKPTIRELAAELSGEAKVAEVNIEENPFIKEKYNIDKYPMLLIFVDGKEAERLVGLKSKKYLNDALQVYIRDQTRAER